MWGFIQSVWTFIKSIWSTITSFFNNVINFFKSIFAFLKGIIDFVYKLFFTIFFCAVAYVGYYVFSGVSAINSKLDELKSNITSVQKMSEELSKSIELMKALGKKAEDTGKKTKDTAKKLKEGWFSIK